MKCAETKPNDNPFVRCCQMYATGTSCLSTCGQCQMEFSPSPSRPSDLKAQLKRIKKDIAMQWPISLMLTYELRMR